MGHVRDGHNNDAESSEFGTGMKKSMIYIAKDSTVFTRSVRKDGTVTLIKIGFDIPSMCDKTDPENSYEPSEFEKISEDTFKRHHKFETGSSIEFSNLNISDVQYDRETAKHMSPSEFDQYIIKELCKTYSDLIRRKIINITLNGTIVVAEKDLVSLIPFENKTQDKLYVELNSKKEPVGIHRVGRTPTGRQSFKKYMFSDSIFIKASHDEFDEFSKKKSVTLVTLDSLSTKNTEYYDNVPGDITQIIRDGRCFGDLKITKQEKDGYSNHIFSKLTYTSKQLNHLLGIGPNKSVCIKSNPLMTAVHKIQKENTKRWRAFCKDGNNRNIDSDSDESVISVSTSPKRQQKKHTKIKLIVDETAHSPILKPIASNDTTILSNDEAILSNDEAILSNDEAILSNDEAILSNDEAILSNDEAILSNDEAILSNDEAILSNAEPSILHKTPVILHEEPDRLSEVTPINNYIPQLQIYTSKENIQTVINKLTALISDPLFNRTDGEILLGLVEKFIDSQQ